jgi:hypothetical protein
MKVKVISPNDVDNDLPTEYGLAEKGALSSEFAGEIVRARRWRANEVRKWDTSLAFLDGQQGNTRERWLDDMKARLGSESFRQIVNRLLPIYKSTCAALKTQMPNLNVVSRSPAYDDELRQLAVSYCVQEWHSRNKISETLNECARWLSACGNAALHTYVKDGCAVTEMVNAYDILFEAEAIRPEDAEWSACRRVVTRSEAASLWPKFAKAFETEASGTNTNGSDTVEYSFDGRRIELWYVYFRDGRCGVFCPGVEKDSGWIEQSEYPEGATPIALMRFTVMPARLYGVSQLWPLLYQQVEYNIFRSILLDGARLMSNPMWLIPMQANVNTGDLSNRAGQPIVYNALGGKPERVPAPPMPAHLFDIQARLMGEMEDVAGMHGMTMGKRSPGISAAVSMQTLINQDIQQLTMCREEVEKALCAAAKTAVALWKEYGVDKRSVSLFDPTFGGDVIRIVRKADLIDKPDVYIEAGTLFVADQEGRDNMLMQLAQLGALPPDVLLRNLSMKIDRRAELDRMKALSTAKRLLGQVISGYEVEWVEDPTTIEAIVAVFREYITSPLYEEGTAELYQRATLGDQNAIDALQIRNNVFEVYRTAHMQIAQMQAGLQGPAPTGSQPGNRAGPVAGAPAAPDQRRQDGASGAKPVQSDKSNMQDKSGSMSNRVQGAP